MGGFMILAENFLYNHPDYTGIMDLIFRLGRIVIQFFETASKAENPIAFDVEIDSHSALAAADCFQLFKVRDLSQPDLLIDIDNISSAMQAINLAVLQRREFGRSTCLAIPNTLASLAPPNFQQQNPIADEDIGAVPTGEYEFDHVDTEDELPTDQDESTGPFEYFDEVD